MRDAEQEQAHWDAAARRGAMGAAWAVEGDETLGIEQCLAQIIPELGLDPDGHPTVLDLGCGPGRLSLAWAARYRNHRVIGVDVSPVMVSVAEQRREALGPLGHHVKHLVTDGRSLPGVLLDGAWSVLLFQHLETETVLHYLALVALRLRRGAAFRFQFFPGSLAHGPWSHDHDPGVLASFCERAGLTVTAIDRDPLAPGGADWAWMTVRR